MYMRGKPISYYDVLKCKNTSWQVKTLTLQFFLEMEMDRKTFTFHDVNITRRKSNFKKLLISFWVVIK